MNYTFETDDDDEALTLLNARKMLTALRNIYEAGRLQLKHGDSSTAERTLDEIKKLAAENIEFAQQ